MKKITISIFLLAVLFLSSCKKNENLDLLVGLWTCTSWEDESGNDLLQFVQGGYTITFNDDNTCIVNLDTFMEFGSYALSEDGNFLYIDDSEYVLTNITNSSLEISLEENSVKQYLKFIK